MSNKMSKELTKKYADKIIEVVYYDTIPDKETVCKVIYALIDEYADQQTKQLQEKLYKESTRADILQDENVKLQERVYELTFELNKYKGTTTQAKSNKLKKILTKKGVKLKRKYVKRPPKIITKIEFEPRNEAEYQKFIKNFELFLASKV